MKKIVILINDEKVTPTVEGNMTYPEVLRAMSTAIYAFSEGAIDIINAEAKKQKLEGADTDAVRNDIYDQMNTIFSNVLEMVIPSKDIPDLTTEAILEAENRMIEEAYSRNMTLEELLEEKRNARTSNKKMS